MPPEKLTPIGYRLQQFLDFFRQCTDVSPTNLRGVRGKGLARGSKETPVGGVGIGTTDQLDFRDVVCGNHPRVAGMKLITEPVLVEPRLDGVDAMRHNQCGAFALLDDEISHRQL
jgi:hypothetical protein